MILSYQGRPVVDTNAFRNEIAATRPGSTVTLRVLREGKTSELKATLEEMTVAREGNRSLDGEREGSGKYGISVEPITPELAAQLDLDRDIRGVVITERRPVGRGGIRRPAGRRCDSAGQRQERALGRRRPRGAQCDVG